jgi:hypothetical protein
MRFRIKDIFDSCACGSITSREHEASRKIHVILSMLIINPCLLYSSFIIPFGAQFTYLTFMDKAARTRVLPQVFYASK